MLLANAAHTSLAKCLLPIRILKSDDVLFLFHVTKKRNKAEEYYGQIVNFDGRVDGVSMCHCVYVGMVEDEEDYVKNLSTLVTCFLRPLRMTASSKKPLISHDDVNSIFLNRFVASKMKC